MGMMADLQHSFVRDGDIDIMPMCRDICTKLCYIGYGHSLVSLLESYFNLLTIM